MKSLYNMLVFLLLQLVQVSLGGRGEEYNVVEEEEKQKNYEEEEEGKIMPHRTFLTTLEITLISVFTIIGFFLIVFCCIYLYCFGCKCPKCCVKCCSKDTSKDDYSQVQLHRERKIGEIWRQN